MKTKFGLISVEVAGQVRSQLPRLQEWECIWRWQTKDLATQSLCRISRAVRMPLTGMQFWKVFIRQNLLEMMVTFKDEAWQALSCRRMPHYMVNSVPEHATRVEWPG